MHMCFCARRCELRKIEMEMSNQCLLINTFKNFQQKKIL